MATCPHCRGRKGWDSYCGETDPPEWVECGACGGTGTVTEAKAQQLRDEMQRRADAMPIKVNEYGCITFAWLVGVPALAASAAVLWAGA
ncbi:unnamed protein product [Gemmataceae bacterium]|nr:unnamed protein product [Gemmataceae bacterium]VTT98988.1 unnamed protein product [Gemmataceae bacterium]